MISSYKHFLKISYIKTTHTTATTFSLSCCLDDAILCVHQDPHCQAEGQFLPQSNKSPEPIFQNTTDCTTYQQPCKATACIVLMRLC